METRSERRKNIILYSITEDCRQAGKIKRRHEKKRARDKTKLDDTRQHIMHQSRRAKTQKEHTHTSTHTQQKKHKTNTGMHITNNKPSRNEMT